MKVAFRHTSLAVALACVVCTLQISPIVTARGQTIFGRISGAVTDSAGGVIIDARVTITNEATKLTRTVTTDERGFYLATNLPVGEYTIAVERDGFKRASVMGYTLVADGRLTVDFTLEAGAITENITITATTGETINTISGEVARVIDGAQVQELALNGRNYMQLTTLVPGAPLINDDQLELMTSLGISQPVNGSRGNANLLTVDGGFNMDSGSNASQVNNVGIDFIHEVKIQTSNFSAEYGRNSGASINVVTRSGGNEFHGSAFEFLRNEKLDSSNFFNNTRGRFTDNAKAKTPDVIVPAGDPRAGEKVVERAPLRYNNFGWSLGGPIKRDKFFFFAGMEWKSIRRSTAPTNRTLPSRAERLGDFSLRLAGADRIPGTADDGRLIDPVTRTQFQGNRIPANRITTDGSAFAAVYDRMESLAAAYTDLPVGNNALYQVSNPFDVRQEIIRLDYKVNDKHTLYGRYIHDDYDLIDPFGVFIGSNLPTIPTNRQRPGFSYQVGHTWLINPKFINEAKVNASWNGQRIPPVGEDWKRESYGFAYQQLFTGGRFDNGIPDTTISGFAGFRGPAGSLLSPTTDIAFSDTLTIVKGSHSLKTGATIIRNRKDQNGRSRYTGDVAFNSSGNTNSTGNAFADVLLGNFRTYSEFADDPIAFFRFTQFEAFVSDGWKVSRNLSLEIGLRYQYGLPIYTQANNIVNFDPSLYDPAQAVTVNPNGTIVPGSGNRFNGLIRAGNGIPADELARVPGGNSPDVLSVPVGAPKGLYEPQHLFAPRIGFAWTPFSDGKTAIRGGFGIFYDRPEGNIIFSSVNIPPLLTSAQFENGNIANIGGGRASALAPFSEIFTIDPNLKTPYSMNWSLSIQRELPGGIFGEAAYVASQGRHLLRQPDVNQPTFEALVENQRRPASQRLSVNALRPFKGYSSLRMRLSDSTSNYHSLQLYAAKRKGSVTMTAGYTWSKALADTSGNGDNPEDPFDRKFNYGPTTFDRRHVFFTTYTYRIPFFRNWGRIADGVFDGWEISGITRYQTGQYLTPTADTSIGRRRADYIGGSVNFPAGAQRPRRWFNVTAFTPAAETRRGTAGVGIIEGPGYYQWDLSLRKKFSVTERTRLQVQADFFNAFNQTDFRNPDINVTPSNAAAGQIPSAAPGRNIQLALKLTF